jgi:hypothetical protein
MTKDKTFQMRCDQEFLDDLQALKDALGLSKAASISMAVKQYIYVADLVRKHQELIDKLKDDLD